MKKIFLFFFMQTAAFLPNDMNKRIINVKNKTGAFQHGMTFDVPAPERM